MHIPYDPDFDTASQQSASSNSHGGFFYNASPRLTFVFGLVFGLMLVSFAGILILLL